MNTSLVKFLFIASLSLSLFSCDKKADEKSSSSHINEKNTVLGFDDITLTPKETTTRWYFFEQAERGRVIFSSRCAVCHGRNAEATPNWKTPNDNGHYPPPPLNGTAHGWHHPISILGRTIYNGGAPVGGQMPAFKDQLAESDIIDVIAHIQTHWSDTIYARWLTIENSSRKKQ
ncbi:MAG: mono/diheme cytochrome c family protein [Candidatus Endobugula sp.]|jgi:mono/diheme cytochrome c family protein